MGHWARPGDGAMCLVLRQFRLLSIVAILAVLKYKMEMPGASNSTKVSHIGGRSRTRRNTRGSGLRRVVSKSTGVCLRVCEMRLASLTCHM